MEYFIFQFGTSIIIFRDIGIKKLKVGHQTVQSLIRLFGCGVYWWQRLISSGSGRIRVNSIMNTKGIDVIGDQGPEINITTLRCLEWSNIFNSKICFILNHVFIHILWLFSFSWVFVNYNFRLNSQHEWLYFYCKHWKSIGNNFIDLYGTSSYIEYYQFHAIVMYVFTLLIIYKK